MDYIDEEGMSLPAAPPEAYYSYRCSYTSATWSVAPDEQWSLDMNINGSFDDDTYSTSSSTILNITLGDTCEGDDCATSTGQPGDCV